MKVIFQPKTPFVTGDGNVYPILAGDCHVDDTTVYFTVMGGLIPMAINRCDIASGGILPHDTDLSAIANDMTFIVDPWPQAPAN